MSEYFSSIQDKTIKSVQYGILSEDDIVQYSSAIVDTKLEQGKDIKIRTIYDPNLGVLKNNQRCSNCKHYRDKCPGHSGHIDVRKYPIYNIIYIDSVVKILKLTCKRCGTLLIPRSKWPEILSYPRRKRMNLLKPYLTTKSSTKRICTNKQCYIEGNVFKQYNNKNVTYNILNMHDIECKDEGSKYLYPPGLAHERISKLNDDEIEVLGYNSKVSHPKDMITRMIFVPPSTIRPSLNYDEHHNTSDGLSKYLKEFIQSLISLKEYDRKEKITSDVKEKAIKKTDLIQKNKFVFNAIISDKGRKYFSMKGGGGATPLPSIKENIAGKAGLYRKNVMGKRVYFMARTVISGDPTIEANEFILPLYLAKKVGMHYTVTPYNIESIKLKIMNGCNTYPGIIYVIKKDKGLQKEFLLWQETLNQPDAILKEKKLFKYKEKASSIIENLQYGDKVYGHIENDTYLILNRQPTLTQYSIGAHKVVVIRDNPTIRLPYAICTPYNADFDGDEMNAKGLHEVTSRVECEYLISAKTYILDNANSSPQIVPIQDNIKAIYLINKFASTKITLNDFMNIIQATDHYNLQYVKSVTTPTYIDIFNAILPHGFNIKIGNFRIKNGRYISGLATKKIIHAIIKYMCAQYGYEYTIKYESALQKTTDKFLILHGITLSINDFIMDKSLKDKIKQNIRQIQIENQKLINVFNKSNVKATSILSVKDIFEREVQNIINIYISKNNCIIKKFIETQKNNHLSNEIQSGARGKIDNAFQIFGCLGQQLVNGKRVQSLYNKRTFPHYPKDDLSIISKGFVPNSYIEGTSMIPYYTSSMVGRGGVMDTALSTAKTGYISRDLAKALESNVVSYDNFIRIGRNGLIMSYSFSNNHYDPKRIFQNKMNLKNMSLDEVKKMYL